MYNSQILYHITSSASLLYSIILCPTKSKSLCSLVNPTVLKGGRLFFFLWIAACFNLLSSNSLLSKTCSYWGLDSLKKLMSNLLLIFVLLSLIIVLIIHCYCLWPSTGIVHYEFRKIPAFMWRGCDCEEMFVQLGGTTYLSCAFFVGHWSSAECCRITYWLVYRLQKEKGILDLADWIVCCPKTSRWSVYWGEMLEGHRDAASSQLLAYRKEGSSWREGTGQT